MRKTCALLGILALALDNSIIPPLVSAARAEILARYDAGRRDGAPPLAPDHYQFNGRPWTAVLNTNADVTVGPVSPDGTNCANAWNISDNSSASGLNVSYSYPLDAATHARAMSDAWELTVVARMVTDFGGTRSGFIQFGNTNTQRRFLVTFDLNASGVLLMQFVGPNGGNDAFARGGDYHTHKIVYSPATDTVNYYVDWQLVRSGWAGDSSPDAIDGPAFGVNSPAGKGSLNFSLAQFGVQPPGPVAKALRYIQVGPFAERTAIQWDAATNPGGPGIKEYVVYRNGLEVQRAPSTTCTDVYLFPCHQYEFTVVAVDNSGAVHSPSLPFPVTSLPAKAAIGTNNVKVLLYNFPDYPGEPFTTNYANDLVFDGAWSAKAYFSEVSYGRLTLQGDTAGWFTMPQPASSYCGSIDENGLWYDCNSSRFIQDALSVLPPEHTNTLGNYANFLMVFQGVGTAGVAAGLYKIFSASNGFRQDVIAHELGHVLDGRGNHASSFLMHASGWSQCTVYRVGPDLLNPTNGCSVERYADDFDAMGAANSYHFSMYYKEMLGFLQPGNIQVADHDGDYELYAAEVPTAAVQMIKIPLEHGMFYFLEYRTLQGFNGPNTPQFGVAPIDGVLIRLRVARFPGSDAYTLRPKIELNPGTPFIDPYRGLRVAVVQKLGGHVIVNISGTGKPLKLTDVRLVGTSNQDVQLDFDSVPGARYLIQSSADLTSWLTEQTRIPALSSSTTQVLPNAAATTKKFFRVGVDTSP
jgi:hypothetical protein